MYLLAVPKFPPGPQEVPSYSSTVFTATVVYPPIPSPAVCVPAPAKSNLAVPIFPPPAQVEPLYSSVAFELGGVNPPNANPSVCVPVPDNLLLAVPIFPPLAHAAAVMILDEIFHSSVLPTIVGVAPPKPNAAV